MGDHPEQLPRWFSVTGINPHHETPQATAVIWPTPNFSYDTFVKRFAIFDRDPEEEPVLR